jgi:hypothetical protein
MYRAQAAQLDADHFNQTRAEGGKLADSLAHRSCNRAAGAQMTNAARRRTQRLPDW